ncbi:MAG: DUF2798 domain-containing protein [Ornithobacterium rhinotracheale]|nr:DUF2798 domain-containing protein [Ornithobacterium rhinotracheale]
MNRELKQTFRFVFFIATPLCLVNSFIFSFGKSSFLHEWLYRFIVNYSLTFPQAICYVSIIRWINGKKS